jgi:predicted permease
VPGGLAANRFAARPSIARSKITMSVFDDLIRDLTYALRVFRRSPTFTLAAVAALTLGIGANTAVFSVVNAVLLTPVAAPDPDRVVMFMNTSPTGRSSAASPAKFAHWRAEADVVQDVSAFRTGVRNLTEGGTPEQVRWGQATADFFRLFGAPFLLGRGFAAEEDRPGGPKAVVLNRAIWERRFGRDPGILGRTVAVGGVPHVVVGVLGDFPFNEFGPEPQIWTPFQLDPNTSDQGHYFNAAGRLKPNVTLEQARARLAISGEAYREKFPDAMPPNAGFSVDPIREALVRDVRPLLFVLAGAVGLVLLIACTNVANLLLARATGRTREIAIRAAVGGTRGRIVRQLLTESVLLSFAGGAAGLLAGTLGIRVLMAISTAGLPRVGESGTRISADWRVLLFAAFVALGTGLLFGAIPAIQGSKGDLTTSLKEGGRAGSGARGNWTRATLVVVEVALALVLLVGSALLIRTAIALTRVDPGFDATNVLSLQTSLAGSGYQTSAGVERAVQNVKERLRAVPGIEIATATCCVPLQGGYGLPFVIAGRPLEGTSHGGGGWRTMSAGYFEVFRIAVIRGRTFTDRDIAGAEPVVIINQAMARQFWPDSDPLADRLIIGRGTMREFATEPERQIIGVVGDTRDGGLNSDPDPMMFVPQAQLPDPVNALNATIRPMTWIVRTRVPPMTISQIVQEEIRQATGVPVTNVRTMDAIVQQSTSRQRFNMWMMTIFGGVALLLAGIGIYGLMAYSVAQRQREIGIRLALGARRIEVGRMVVLQGMRLAVVGIAIGLSAAWALSRFISAFVFGVDVHDALVFASVPAVLALVTVCAVLIPAFRASRVDAVVALRAE